MVALVTGSAGVVGRSVVTKLLAEGMVVLGVDNDMRGYWFGVEGSTRPTIEDMSGWTGYFHYGHDVTSNDMYDVMKGYGESIELVVHCAGQPSHDFSARDPRMDFQHNAVATVHLLEGTRAYCPNALFIYMSTNKVYGDLVNRIPIEGAYNAYPAFSLMLKEYETRYDLRTPIPPYAGMAGISIKGVNEVMPIEHSMHSPFGVSKLAGDLMTQEYGQYFGMRTVCFRCGCLTGGAHQGVKLHGFLAYLCRCARRDLDYQIIGYEGKQVRDQLHADDVAEAVWQVFERPREGSEVYNLGGGRMNSISVLEAIRKAETILGRDMRISPARPPTRLGDHIWWISDTSRFQKHYPDWEPTRTVKSMMEEMLCDSI